MTHYMMVLNDGETFTSLAGCRIIAVPNEWEKDYLDWEEDDDIEIVTEFP